MVEHATPDAYGLEPSAGFEIVEGARGDAEPLRCFLTGEEGVVGIGASKRLQFLSKCLHLPAEAAEEPVYFIRKRRFRTRLGLAGSVRVG